MWNTLQAEFIELARQPRIVGPWFLYEILTNNHARSFRFGKSDGGAVPLHQVLLLGSAGASRK
jgi:hypothetical protein